MAKNREGNEHINHAGRSEVDTPAGVFRSGCSSVNRKQPKAVKMIRCVTKKNYISAVSSSLSSPLLLLFV